MTDHDALTAARPTGRVWPDTVPAPRLTASGPQLGVTVADILVDLDHAISYRRVDYWLHAYAEQVLDDPARRHPRAGSGHQRRFTTAEAARLVRMGRLVLAGHRPDAAAALAAQDDDRPSLEMAWATHRGECT